MIDARHLALADAVMYEGAVLYPYRRSALKNQHRWTFGVISPRGGAAVGLRTALAGTCLLAAPATTVSVDVLLRFTTEAGSSTALRQVRAQARQGASRTEFAFGSVRGALVLERTALGAGYERLQVCVLNSTELVPPPASVVNVVRGRSTGGAHALYGVHMLLSVGGADSFVSLTDPGADAEPYAALCESDGLWCALLAPRRSDHRATHALLAPIILPDFPALAPESCGILCDSTEIDEMLALRIRTLTDAEKREARAGDPQVRAMLDRVESLSAAQLLQLHGTRRCGSARYHAARALLGARVVLRPRRSADALDILLAGREATVQAVEQDLEGKVLLGVTLDEDPGRDLGAGGLPGHRFFFEQDEVEVLTRESVE